MVYSSIVVTHPMPKEEKRTNIVHGCDKEMEEIHKNLAELQRRRNSRENKICICLIAVPFVLFAIAVCMRS